MNPPYSAEKIYQYCLPTVEAHLKSKVSCPALIEDLQQDLYIKLMLVEHWHEIENIPGYVVTILNNLINDHYRKQPKHNENLDHYEFAAPHCIETQVNQSQSIEHISTLMGQQKKELQDLLWRAKVTGQSHQQIAKDKGRSLSWVEKSLAQLVHKCRKWVLEQEER